MFPGQFRTARLPIFATRQIYNSRLSASNNYGSTQLRVVWEGLMERRIQIEEGLRGTPDIGIIYSIVSFNGRRNYLESEVFGDTVNDVRSHAAHLFRVGSDQCVFANGVNQARKASRMAKHGGNGLCGKQYARMRVCSCDLQAPFDVFRSLDYIEWIKSRAKGDSLLELSKSDGIQLLIQFRLSDQKNLQQLVISCLQVRQEANLFENFRRKMVCLVHDENRSQFLRSSRDYKMPQFKQ